MPSTPNEFLVTPGCKLEMGNSDYSSLNQLLGIAKIGGLPEETVDKFETQVLDQVNAAGDADLFKKFGYGWITPGMLKLSFRFREDLLQTLRDERHVEHGFVYTFSNQAKMKFVGVIEVVRLEVDDKADTLIGTDVQLQGDWEYVPAP